MVGLEPEPKPDFAATAVCLHQSHLSAHACYALGTPPGTLHHQNHLFSKSSYPHFIGKITEAQKVKSHADSG